MNSAKTVKQPASGTSVLEKAIAFQRQQLVPPSNNEWLATRLLFEKQFGSMDEVTKLTQQLLAAQKPEPVKIR